MAVEHNAHNELRNFELSGRGRAGRSKMKIGGSVSVLLLADRISLGASNAHSRNAAL